MENQHCTVGYREVQRAEQIFVIERTDCAEQIADDERPEPFVPEKI